MDDRRSHRLCHDFRRSGCQGQHRCTPVHSQRTGGERKHSIPFQHGMDRSNDPGGRIQTKSAASSQQNGVGALHQSPRFTQVRFTRTGSCSAHIDSDDGARATEHDRTTGERFDIVGVANLYPSNVGYGTIPPDEPGGISVHFCKAIV